MKYIVLELKITASDDTDIEQLREMLLMNGTDCPCEGSSIYHARSGKAGDLMIVGEVKFAKASVYPKEALA